MSMNEDELIRSLAGLRDDAIADDLAQRMLADAALQQARRSRPEASPLLQARMLRDARRVARGRRWQDRLAFGGLVAAGLVGVMMGLLDPGALVSGGTAGAAEYIGGYDFQLAGAE